MIGAPQSSILLGVKAQGKTAERPRYLLPADAYSSRRWFAAEQARVLDATWHRGSNGSEVDWWEGLDFSSERPAVPLKVAFGSLPEAMGSVRPGLLVELARRDLEGRFNWKLFIENHIDVLHLWYLHDRSLADFDHGRFDHRSLGSNWASYEPFRVGLDHPRPAEFVIPHLDRRDRVGLGAHLLFPDTPMALAADFFLTYRARPVAFDRTVVELRLLGAPGVDGEALIDVPIGFIEEDMEACERIQHVVSSRHFAVGPLAIGHEAPLASFHRNLLDLLGDPPA